MPGDHQGASPGAVPCTAGVLEVTMELQLLLLPQRSQQPGLGGARGKIRNQGGKCSGNAASKAREKHPALSQTSRCVSQPAVEQERDTETKGHPLHRHLQVSQTLLSALEAPAPMGFVAKFKLVLQHEEKELFCLSLKRANLALPTTLVQTLGIVHL